MTKAKPLPREIILASLASGNYFCAFHIIPSGELNSCFVSSEITLKAADCQVKALRPTGTTHGGEMVYARKCIKIGLAEGTNWKASADPGWRSGSCSPKSTIPSSDRYLRLLESIQLIKFRYISILEKVCCSNKKEAEGSS